MFFFFGLFVKQLSTALLQDGHPEELDDVINEREEEQRREREALEAQFDAEEAEHTKALNQALDEEHVHKVKASQKDLFNKVQGRFLREKTTITFSLCF